MMTETQMRFNHWECVTSGNYDYFLEPDGQLWIAYDDEGRCYVGDLNDGDWESICAGASPIEDGWDGWVVEEASE